MKFWITLAHRKDPPKTSEEYKIDSLMPFELGCILTGFAVKHNCEFADILIRLETGVPWFLNQLEAWESGKAEEQEKDMWGS